MSDTTVETIAFISKSILGDERFFQIRADDHDIQSMIADLIILLFDPLQHIKTCQ